MRLVDSSIWIDHFQRPDPILVNTIEQDELLCHPAIIGELALGSLRERAVVLALLQAQRMIRVATHAEVMTMIDRHRLHSMGIGYTDAHLLASVLIDGEAALWTRDKRLQVAASRAGARLFAG